MTMSWLVIHHGGKRTKAQPLGLRNPAWQSNHRLRFKTQIFVILLLRAMDQYRGARSIIHGPAATFVA
jgi:hypothetical protein